MMSRKVFFVVSILVIFVLALSACAPQSSVAPTEVVEEAPAAQNGGGNGDGSGSGSGNGSGDGAAADAAAEEPAAEETVVEEAAEADAGAPAEEAPALKITGMVENEMNWSEDEVKAMDTLDVESTNSKGETSSYTGVLLSDLIQAAAPTADAATVVFVADDGYTAEAGLADVMGCADCILSFRSKGGFSSVLPAFDKSLQVKGVIEIQVK